jgi:Zn-dependent protease with chaperone function
LNGDDGGMYLASAQLFIHDLLALKAGPDKIRALLAQLAAHENWQSAFFTAFREDFRRPLDVEKWWALRVVSFAARAPGPQWTPAVSRDKLDAALAVPVNIRYASNSLPSYAEISLQAVLNRNYSAKGSTENAGRQVHPRI